MGSAEERRVQGGVGMTVCVGATCIATGSVRLELSCCPSAASRHAPFPVDICCHCISTEKLP